jgi:hypothetical protein
MRRHVLRVTASSLKSCPLLADYMEANPSPGVFPRSVADLKAASRRSALLHAEVNGEIVGLAGVFETKYGIHDIGGVRVTLNGFRLQRLLMAMLAVQTHVTRETYEAITATTFAANVESVANIRSQFELWESAPEQLLVEKTEKAAGEAFLLFHAPPLRLWRMALDLLRVAETPILQTADLRQAIHVDFDHALLTIFRPAVEAFIATLSTGSLRLLDRSAILREPARSPLDRRDTL